MPMRKFRPIILLLLALATQGIVQAGDMAMDCRLKGGSMVPLSAEACKMEGGAPVNAAVAPAPAAAPEPAASGVQAPPSGTSLAKLEETQNWIVGLLAKPVVETMPLNRKPEGIERSARFDGCRLMVDENLHIEYGNLISAAMDFKIGSVIDFQKINREEFGILGKISAKVGDLNGAAVYFEERKLRGGNNISISVLNLRKDGYAKYRSHSTAAFWDAPRDDLWMADEYGYVKDNGWGDVATDKIRILLIVNTSDEAAKLMNAFEEVYTMCKPQQAGTN